MHSTITSGYPSPSDLRLRLGLLLPSERELRAAPQLVTVALAHAAIAAVRCALEAAHPILVPGAWPDTPPELADAEHFATLILHVSDRLAELLDDYASVFGTPETDTTASASVLR